LDTSYKLFEEIYLLLVLLRIVANTVQISKTAARPLRGSKSFYHFLMDPNQLTKPEKVIGLEGESGEERKKQRGEVG
jgi:hypothetical protein